MRLADDRSLGSLSVSGSDITSYISHMCLTNIVNGDFKSIDIKKKKKS